jgi:hypothetical protein
VNCRVSYLIDYLCLLSLPVGSWIASLKPGMTPASVSTAAAAGSSNATVGVSGARNMRLRKGGGGKGAAPHMPAAGGGGYADAYSQYPDAAMAPKPRRRTGFKPVWGEDGLWMSESGVIPADSTVAAGPRHVMHIVNSLVKITTVDPGHGVPTGTDGYGYEPSPDATIVTLPDFFGLVASSCDGGYITPSAVYDKHAGRFIVTAVCGGDANQILVAVSQCEDATAGWWLYSFPGYVTYDTHMACTDGSNHFEPTSIHTQVRGCVQTWDVRSCSFTVWAVAVAIAVGLADVHMLLDFVLSYHAVSIFHCCCLLVHLLFTAGWLQQGRRVCQLCPELPTV